MSPAEPSSTPPLPLSTVCHWVNSLPSQSQFLINNVRIIKTCLAGWVLGLVVVQHTVSPRELLGCSSCYFYSNVLMRSSVGDMFSL